MSFQNGSVHFCSAPPVSVHASALLAVSILLVSSVFLIKGGAGGAGVLLHYIGYNESTPVYTDGAYDTKQKPPYAFAQPATMAPSPDRVYRLALFS